MRQQQSQKMQQRVCREASSSLVHFPPAASTCPASATVLPLPRPTMMPGRRNHRSWSANTSTTTTMPKATLMTLMLICCLFCCWSTTVVANSAEGGSRCASCEQRAFEEYKKARQDQILKDLLKKLDLPAKPNVTVDFDSLRYIAPRNPRIQALIEQSRRERNDHIRVRKSIQQWPRRSGGGGSPADEEADYFPALYETEHEQPVETSYILAQAAPQWLDQQELPTALFKFSADLRKKFVTSAKFNVFLRRPSEPFEFGQMSTRLNIFQRFPNGTLGPRLVSKHLELNFDVTTAFEQVVLQLDSMEIQAWIETGLQFEEPPMDEADGQAETQAVEPDERSPSTVGLYVEAMYEGENLAQYPNDAGDGEQPASSSADGLMFFELELINLKSGRSRRNTNTCRPGSNHTKCCLYDLVIDFEKIGWGFVIAPKRYNAYVCSGECTGMGSGSQMGRAQAAAAAKIDHFQCCHPKEYAGITILFVQENNNVMMREVPNMVAKDCGCT